jgi:hypothetical protein
MLATEWNMEDALRVCREEAWEESREETRKEAHDVFSNLMNQAKSMDELRKMFEESFSVEAGVLVAGTCTPDGVSPLAVENPAEPQTPTRSPPSPFS